MRKLIFATGLVLGVVVWACAQQGSLLIDDFEGPVSGGFDGTFDYGAGSGSTLEVAAATDIKNTGAQSIRLTYNAVAGGYMWAARGFGLDAKNAAWLVKDTDIDWTKYNAISFYMYGSGSKAKVAFDLKDAGQELWRTVVIDDFKGWKKIVCPFKDFQVRDDWQPDTADKNLTLNFPVRSFQFEMLPEAKGVLYLDTVELTSK